MKTLVVDDDATSRFYLQEILTSYGEVHSCVDGAEAVQAFQRSLDLGSPYQLICLDIMMPSTSGLLALQEIRQAEERGNRGYGPRARVLMITALGDSKTVVTAFHQQCDGYLVKPVDKAKLLNHLRSLALIP
jgi:two-component system, chemotaxis family, chemotaxis protein CheY